MKITITINVKETTPSLSHSQCIGKDFPNALTDNIWPEIKKKKKMCEPHPQKLNGGSETLILKPTNSSGQIKLIKIRKFKLLFWRNWGDPERIKMTNNFFIQFKKKKN